MASETSALWMRRLSKLIPVGLLIALVAIVVPAVLHSQESARLLRSKYNLKQFALALHTYHDAFLTLPPGGTFDSNEVAHHSWFTFIDPYLAASPWHTFVDFDLPWDHPNNLAVFLAGGYGAQHLQNPRVVEQRSPDGFHLVHYSANQWLMHRNSSIQLADITNGTGSTVLLGESAGQYPPAGYPYNWREVALGIGRDSSGFGCQARTDAVIVMADGSTRVLSNLTDGAIFFHMEGPNGLRPNDDDTSKPVAAYALKEHDFWSFDFNLGRERSLNSFRISPDATTIEITIQAENRSINSNDNWTSIFQDAQKVAKLKVIKIKGPLNAPELRSIWELPNLKRLDLSQAHVGGDVDLILKEAPAGLTIER